MDTQINLDDSVLAPKRPLSMEPADTEGHMSTSPADDSEPAVADEDTEGQISL